jgi:hypothetical protein
MILHYTVARNVCGFDAMSWLLHVSPHLPCCVLGCVVVTGDVCALFVRSNTDGANVYRA